MKMNEEIRNGVLGYNGSDGKWRAYDSALLTDRIIRLENKIASTPVSAQFAGEMEEAIEHYEQFIADIQAFATAGLNNKSMIYRHVLKQIEARCKYPVCTDLEKARNIISRLAAERGTETEADNG